MRPMEITRKRDDVDRNTGRNAKFASKVWKELTRITHTGKRIIPAAAVSCVCVSMFMFTFASHHFSAFLGPYLWTSFNRMGGRRGARGR